MWSPSPSFYNWIIFIIKGKLPQFKPNKVCKLIKSIYGLKQASIKWYEKLSSFLLRHQYTQSSSDHSLFTKKTDTTFTVLLVYVDDVIITGDSLSEFHNIKAILLSSFTIKDLGQLKYFLGLELAHSLQDISLCQSKYCLDLLTDSGFLAFKPVSTPFNPFCRLHQDSSAHYHDIPSYRILIGRLVYLTNTRPTITFTTQQLNKFLFAHTKKHFTAATRVLRYLKRCLGQGL